MKFIFPPSKEMGHVEQSHFSLAQSTKINKKNKKINYQITE